MEGACQDLNLILKPSKCVSITLHKGKPKKNIKYRLQNGETKNISDGHTKFLGHVVAATTSKSKTTASKLFYDQVTSALTNIDSRPIRGEMKTWIVRNYLNPSLQFQLAVNLTCKGTILKVENNISKLLKKWLCLPKSATRVIFHHPAILSVPPIQHVKITAKLSYLCSIMNTSDPAIQEINHLIDDKAFIERNDIPNEAVSTLKDFKPRPPRLTSTPHQMKRNARKLTATKLKLDLEAKLNSLEVQSKFTDIIELEESTRIWKRIIDGMPAGQLSFILRAGSDTLPMPMNLHRWKIQLYSHCPLCSFPQTTVNHILNGCQYALDGRRYTWRHDSILRKLIMFMKSKITTSTQMFADLDGHRAIESPPGTVPPSIVITTARPDIAIVQGKKFKFIELTVCGNSLHAMQKARERKLRKPNYQQLFSDLNRRGYLHKYYTLEIGALGHHHPDTLHQMHKLFPEIGVPLWRELFSEIALMSISASRTIFEAARTKE